MKLIKEKKERKRNKNKIIMPKNIHNTFGDGRLEKGTWKDMEVIAWDFSSDCEGDSCPLWEICGYKERCHPGKEIIKPGDTKKCGMQLRYLKNALTGVIMLYGVDGKEHTMAEMVRVGYHLLPLYNQLFKFKRLEYAEKELYSISDKGSIKINPVFKEIREIIASLEAVWAKIMPKSSGKNKRGRDDAQEGDFLDAMHQIVSVQRGELPINPEEEDFDEDLEYFDGSEEKESTGIDFSQGIIPEEAPKKKKIRTPEQEAKRKKRIYKAKKKWKRKVKKRKNEEKRQKEKDNLRALNKRIREDARKNSLRKMKEKEAERAEREAELANKEE